MKGQLQVATAAVLYEAQTITALRMTSLLCYAVSATAGSALDMLDRLMKADCRAGTADCPGPEEQHVTGSRMPLCQPESLVPFRNLPTSTISFLRARGNSRTQIILYQSKVVHRPSVSMGIEAITQHFCETTSTTRISTMPKAKRVSNHQQNLGVQGGRGEW